MNDTAPRALIMTVGLPGDQGGDVLDALELDLETLKPDFLILLASGQSVPNARRMRERSGLDADHSEIVELASAHDLDSVFRETNLAVGRLIARGFPPELIAINYTSGTKVMGSGAVLSAVYNKIRELRYITGLGAVRESDRARRRILSTEPAAVFAYQDLLDAVKMTRDLRFQSARLMLERTQETLLSPNAQDLRAQLSPLARAYEEWDNFYPEQFSDNYTRVRFGAEPLRPFELADGQLNAIAALVSERGERRPGPHIITDLCNNAVRRILTGRAEDAFSRLYRALEMLAQWVLLRDAGIDTNDVDTHRIPPRDRVGYEALRSLEDGMVKIGMRKAFELLVILDTPLGRRFEADKMIRELLARRSGSILAHGYTPADPSLATEFHAHSRDLMASEIQDFPTLERHLQFPWILERLSRVESSQ